LLLANYIRLRKYAPQRGSTSGMAAAANSGAVMDFDVLELQQEARK
jgi:hypothetical protein